MTDGSDPPPSAPPVAPSPFPPSRLRGADFVAVGVAWYGLRLLALNCLPQFAMAQGDSPRLIRMLGVLCGAQLLAVFVPLAIVRRAGPSALGVRVGDGLRGLRWAAGAGAVLLGGFSLAALAFHVYDGTNLFRLAFGTTSPLELARSPGVRAGVTVSMVVVGPLSEEVFFRGVLYQGLRRTFRPWEANLASSLIFAFFHDERIPWIQFVGGATFALLYEKTGALFAPVLVHGAGNLAILLLPLLLK